MTPLMVDEELAARIESLAAHEGRTVNEVLTAMLASYRQFRPEDFGIELADPDTEAADEALWAAKFARSQSVLDQLIEGAEAEIAAGLVEEFDPDEGRI